MEGKDKDREESVSNCISFLANFESLSIENATDVKIMVVCDLIRRGTEIGILEFNRAGPRLGHGITEFSGYSSKILGETLSISTTITGISFNKIKKVEDILKQALHPKSAISELYLRKNELGEEGGRKLAKILTNYKDCITVLHISTNRIESIATILIARALQSQTGLISVKLKNNSIGPKGTEGIAKIIEDHPSLAELHVGKNRIDTESAKLLVKPIEKHRSLVKLHLHENFINADGMHEVMAALEKCTACNDLSFKILVSVRGDLGDLLKDLYKAKSITKLSLERSCTPYIEIINALPNHTMLTKLSIDGGSFGSGCPKALARALKDCRSLTSFYLWRNSIMGPEGFKDILLILKNNEGLKRLSLGGNRLGVEPIKLLVFALQNHTSLIKLSLWENYMEDEGAKALTPLLRSNLNLEKFYANDNRCKENGVTAILEALEGHPQLTIVILDKVKLGKRGTDALNKLLALNPLLRTE